MAGWIERLHELRRREIEIIFEGVDPGAYELGLELGAGDGFQSNLLTRYVRRLISTDINLARLRHAGSTPAQLVVCDAREPDRLFKPGVFDLVFSSNLLEHIPNPARTLRGVFDLLKPGGISIHVMPSPFMKATWLVLFFPNRLYRLWRVLWDSGQRRRVREKLSGDQETMWENNPFEARPGFLRRQLWPAPHGAYNSHLAELWLYRRTRWAELIEQQGFEVKRILSLPVTTGYELDIPGWSRLFEGLAQSSAFAYLSRKAE